MKLLVLLMLFIIASCTAPDVAKKGEPKPVYMSKAEIIAEVSALSKTKALQASEQYSPADLERLNNLIDNRIFFGQRIKHKKNKPMQFKGLAEVDLRHRDTPVKAQDNGKCSAYAGVAAIENTINRSGVVRGLDLSEWDSWSHYGQYSCEAFIKAATKTKICDEKYAPQYGRVSAECENNAYAMIKEQTYIDDDITKMMAALDRGNVVYIGMSTPNDMVRCKKVISPNTTVSNGGHALLLVGYYKENNQVIGIIKNSWGTDCADSGYQYMPLTLCNRSDMYCIAWEIKSVDLAKVVTPVEPECKSWKRIWWKPWVRTCVEWV
jgi:C1A family cysteine protease